MNYGGFAQEGRWNPDSRPLSDATNTIRSYVLQNIVTDNNYELDRLTKYFLYWKFYDGFHYKDFNDGMLSFNYIRAFIDKVNMFLLGDEAFSLSVKSYYNTQVNSELEKIVEELMLYHWGKSDKVSKCYEILQMGSITGDCWVGLTWEELEAFVKVNVYDSRQCFPKFVDGDYNRLESIRIRQPIEIGQNKKDYRMFVTEISDKSITTWYQKDSATQDPTVYEKKVRENPYGFIPIIHIKNKPNSSTYYGKSDATDILKINKIYNDIMQQLKAVIDYHMTPTTVITGGTVKSLKRGLGEIWSGLPSDASVFNLGLDVDISATVDFAKDLKAAMHELSDVPENALGKIQAISNTSAAALQITYHPLIQQANLKSTTYGMGITALNTMMLRVLDVHRPNDERLQRAFELSENFLSEIKISPVFAYGFPKDKMDELQRAEIELRLGLASRKEIMTRLGKQNADEIFKQIEEDKETDAKYEALKQAMALGGFGGSSFPEDTEDDDDTDDLED